MDFVAFVSFLVLILAWIGLPSTSPRQVEAPAALRTAGAKA